MLTVISPAKRLDDKASLPAGFTTTQPEFAADAVVLAGVAQKLSANRLRKLMDISQPLAELNANRFASFADAPEKPAALFFAGDTYAGLEAKTLDPDALTWAQDHLRILSGLYGLLRPLDAIKAYRLEMGSKLKNPRGADLYAYWRATLAPALNAAAAQTDARALVNCASVEYFGAVDTKALALPVITPTFLEDKNGEAKIVSFFAKKARGAMARFIAENHLSDPESLKDFKTGGYTYQPHRSTPDNPVFLRKA
ncbi:peroxide stress protein YaaA [Pseudorhodobacter sp. E13]|uniref:peroxide stress protein YaaA n=1 Tax=Pseudorhodobacter sp. E13 TaxID=2487931 RepID=UPI000F8F64D1|nr:peroxide stress protein YaaA [Pseudorhodobacter sp. E13]RUS63407.1 peroxide stress protein YaaA [Pseudorhodobacter sp. E13]